MTELVGTDAAAAAALGNLSLETGDEDATPVSTPTAQSASSAFPQAGGEPSSKQKRRAENPEHKAFFEEVKRAITEGKAVIIINGASAPYADVILICGGQIELFQTKRYAEHELTAENVCHEFHKMGSRTRLATLGVFTTKVSNTQLDPALKKEYVALKKGKLIVRRKALFEAGCGDDNVGAMIREFAEAFETPKPDTNDKQQPLPVDYYITVVAHASKTDLKSEPFNHRLGQEENTLRLLRGSAKVPRAELILFDDAAVAPLFPIVLPKLGEGKIQSMTKSIVYR